MRWFNLKTGIIILVIIIILVAIGVGIVVYSLWDVTKAKELFPFLEISEVFPTKAVALFTGLATFGTLVLALATILTIKNNNEREKRRRQEELAKEKRDKDEHLLNEIIEWALDVLTRNSPPDILKSPEWVLEAKYDTEGKIRLAQVYTYMDLINQYSVAQLYGKEYILRIAPGMRNDLGKAVDNLINKIEEHLKVLFEGAEHTVKLEEYGTLIDIFVKGKSELRDGLSEDAKYQVKVFDDRVELNKYATKVVEIALEIKARDIG